MTGESHRIDRHKEAGVHDNADTKDGIRLENVDSPRLFCDISEPNQPSRGLFVVDFCFATLSTALHTHANAICIDADKASATRVDTPKNKAELSLVPKQPFIQSKDFEK